MRERISLSAPVSARDVVSSVADCLSREEDTGKEGEQHLNLSFTLAGAVEGLFLDFFQKFFWLIHRVVTQLL